MEFYNLMWTVLKELLKESRVQDEEGKWNHKNGFVEEKTSIRIIWYSWAKPTIALVSHKYETA